MVLANVFLNQLVTVPLLFQGRQNSFKLHHNHVTYLHSAKLIQMDVTVMS